MIEIRTDAKVGLFKRSTKSSLHRTIPFWTYVLDVTYNPRQEAYWCLSTKRGKGLEIVDLT